jgi:hypothetical protein
MLLMDILPIDSNSKLVVISAFCETCMAVLTEGISIPLFSVSFNDEDLLKNRLCTHHTGLFMTTAWFGCAGGDPEPRLSSRFYV